MIEFPEAFPGECERCGTPILRVPSRDLMLDCTKAGDVEHECQENEE